MRPMPADNILTRRAPGAALACALCLLFGACSLDGASKKQAAPETPRGAQPPRASLPMPPAESAHRTAERRGAWTTLDGRRAGLEDYRGQVVVLDFYATYCPPCKEEIPHLVALQRRYGPQGFKVIGLNVGGPEDRPKVPEFVRLYGIQYELAEPDPETTRLFLADNSAIPQTFVLDRRGRLVRHFVGYDPEVASELERAVADALAEKAD